MTRDRCLNALAKSIAAVAVVLCVGSVGFQASMLLYLGVQTVGALVVFFAVAALAALLWAVNRLDARGL